MTIATKPLPLFEAERDVLLPPPTPSLVQWAEANLVLPKNSPAGAQWSISHTPWLREPMDCLSDGITTEVDIAACTQSGKSETTNALIGYTFDVRMGPLMIVMPTEDVVKTRVRTRIKKVFKNNPRLLQLLPEGKLQNLRVGQETIFSNDDVLYLAWANSAITLSDKPVRVLIFDEPCKYPPTVGNDTDPISLGKNRTGSYRDRKKIFTVCSPLEATDLFWVQWLKGDRCRWHAQCPHCGDRHILRWHDPERPGVYVVIDRDSRGQFLRADDYKDGGNARYVCPSCTQAWTEYHRWQAVCAGCWVPEGYGVTAAGEIVGKLRTRRHRSFQITALMLDPVFRTVDDLVAMWVDAVRAQKDGNVEKLKDFVTNQQAEPWRQEEKKTEIEVLARHVDRDYRMGEVPPDVRLVTAGFDVQLDHVWAVLIGWGRLNESWWLWDQRLETGDTEQPVNYELVREFMRSVWPLQDDPKRQMPIVRGSIDCAYHTEAVETFCQACQQQRIGLLAARGSEHVRHKLYQAFKIEGKLVTRYDVNTGVFKDFLYHLLFETNQPGPDYMHLPRDVSEDTRLQLSSQDRAIWRDRGRIRREWRDKDTGVGPHKWDAAVHARFAAMLAGVWRLARPTAGDGPARTSQRPRWLANLPKLEL